MIDDVDRTLQALLDDPGLTANFPELLAANIAFDRPDDTFTPQGPASLNLFLYDVRENANLRNNEPIIRRNGQIGVTELPPLRVDCSYLITAWPTGAPPLELREHQLLGQALQVLAAHPTIPEPLLQGVLAGQEPPLPMIVPQVDGLKSPADFWTAMGNRVRASITATVTFSMTIRSNLSAPLVTSKHTGFAPGQGLEPDTLVQVGGRILHAGTGVAEAVVDVVDAGLRTTTDSEGRYSFAQVPQGAREFRVSAVGFQRFTSAVTVPDLAEAFNFTLTSL